MATYKGGIPKLRFGTDLAPDQEPLGKPLFLTTGMPVLGKEEKPERDHLATVIAKRSSDTPATIPPSAFAPDELSDDGTVIRMLHEDRWGNEIYRVDRTVALGDEATLPTWRTASTQPVDWQHHDALMAEARAAACEVLGTERVEAYEREKAARLAPRKAEPMAPAYAVTAKDEEAMEQRANTAAILAALGWPTRMAYAGPYGHTMAELADPTTADRDYW